MITAKKLDHWIAQLKARRAQIDAMLHAARMRQRTLSSQQ